MKALLRLLYAAAMGVTLALLLFWEHLEYIYKREFALSNAALLALDAVVLALLAAAAVLMRRKGRFSFGQPRRKGGAHFDGSCALWRADCSVPQQPVRGGLGCGGHCGEYASAG